MHYRARTAYRNGKIASSYDEERFVSIRGRIEDSLEKRALLRTLSGVEVDGSLLEIPCGTGRITDFLGSRGFTLFGVDISIEMLQVARKKLQGVEGVSALLQGEAERLPFRDSAFEGVVCVRLFGHVPPHLRIAILREFARVSRKFVVASYPMADSLRGMMRHLFPPSPMWFPINKRQIKHEAAHASLNVEKIKRVLGRYSETAFVLFAKG